MIKLGLTKDSLLAYLIVALVFSLIFSAVRLLNGSYFLLHGPPYALAEVTRSIYNSASLTPAYFQEVYQQAQEFSKETGGHVWQDVFALDESGELVPKHSLISSLLALPFYALFGDFGFFVLQQVFYLLILASIYKVVLELDQSQKPKLSVYACCALSPIILFAGNFGQDLHGAASLIGGFALARKHTFLGVLVMCLSCFVRPANLILVLPLCFVWKLVPEVGLSLLKASLGLCVGVILLFLNNYYFWGDPLKFTYSNLPIFYNGQMYIDQHPIGFSITELFSSWPEKIWGTHGMLPGIPAFFLLPLTIWAAVKHKYNKFLVALLLICLFYTIYIFSYPLWDSSQSGNRFLLPIVFLYLVPCILGLSRLVTYFQKLLTPYCRTLRE